jgi:hypothetical protein
MVPVFEKRQRGRIIDSRLHAVDIQMRRQRVAAERAQIVNLRRLLARGGRELRTPGSLSKRPRSLQTRAVQNRG